MDIILWDPSQHLNWHLLISTQVYLKNITCHQKPHVLQALHPVITQDLRHWVGAPGHLHWVLWSWGNHIQICQGVLLLAQHCTWWTQGTANHGLNGHDCSMSLTSTPWEVIHVSFLVSCHSHEASSWPRLTLCWQDVWQNLQGTLCKGNLMIEHNTQILARGIQSILDKYNTAEGCIPCKGDPKRKL